MYTSYNPPAPIVANPTGVKALAALPKGFIASLPALDKRLVPLGAADPTSSGANKLAPAVFILPSASSSAANAAAILGCPKTCNPFNKPFAALP